jgi:hypothetical protein
VGGLVEALGLPLSKVTSCSLEGRFGLNHRELYDWKEVSRSWYELFNRRVKQ